MKHLHYNCINGQYINLGYVKPEQTSLSQRTCRTQSCDREMDLKCQKDRERDLSKP